MIRQTDLFVETATSQGIALGCVCWRHKLVQPLVWSVLAIYLGYTMKAEFTAIIERAPEGGFWAICPEIPGANGQGDSAEEAKASLGQAIELIFDDRLESLIVG